MLACDKHSSLLVPFEDNEVNVNTVHVVAHVLMILMLVRTHHSNVKRGGLVCYITIPKEH